jgi:hypothetical protein
MLTLCGPDRIARGAVSGASGDVGDLSALMPAAQFGFSGFSGRIHSGEFEVTEREHAYLNTAIVLAGTITDILADPAKRPAGRGVDIDTGKSEYIKNWLKNKEE